MQSFNNDITLNEQPNFTEITIQFKKSEYSSTIWMHFFIVVIFATVGLTTLTSSIINQSFDDGFFLVIWLLLVFFIGYQGYGNILWLKKGKEIITLSNNHITLKKIYPSSKIYFFTEYQPVIIAYDDLNRVYYSRYIPFRNSFPSKSKGNLHFQDQNQIYSFAINLNQQECTPIIRLIKQKVPNCKTNV